MSAQPPSLPERGGHQNTGGPSPRRDPGPVSFLQGRLALMPSSLGVGLECCPWGEGQSHPSQPAG